MKIKLFCSFIFLFLFLSAWSQTTKVSGKVTDVLTNEPVPFANIVFKGTATGTTSDINGNYSIATSASSDSLLASFVGYQPAVMPVAKGKTQVINFSLKVNKIDLPEIVIRPGENPALVMLKKIIDNKNQNDKTKLESYRYEVYNKVEFDVSNITEKFKKKKLLKPFAFVFEHVDTEATNKKPFLPVFISETLSDFYFRSNPRTEKEIIRASKVSGVENATITQFLGDMYQNTNVYENFINVFGKNFVSPIAGFGTIYYKYYLVDSAFIGDKWCYKITFQPRRKQELTFIGDFWVHDTTFAIKKISARIANDANINFIEDLAVVQEYELIDNKQWMLSKDMLVADFVAKEEGMSFIGRKSSSYKKFVLNEPLPDDVFKNNTGNIIVTEDATQKNIQYWNEVRHDTLSDREKRIYTLVDTIKSLPAFKTYVDIITLLVTGYKEIGKVEIGPYFTMYSFNEVEGNRFRMGGITSTSFSQNVMLDGYVAYGTKDKRFKYKGGVQFLLTKKHRQYIGLSYKNDIEQLGQSENAFQGDNILASVLRRIPSHKLTTIEEDKMYYEWEWFQGLSNKLAFTHRFYIPILPLDYSYYTDEAKTTSKNSLNTSEISLYTRFAYQEKFVEGERTRISLGSKYPILQLNYVLGLKGIWGSDFTYHKISMKVEDDFPVAPFGYTYYLVEAGKIWGTLPYPLLEVHRGNQTYTYDYMAFNLMNYYEFISNEYASLCLVHHFGGFFFDKIPLMRKLKWREIISTKAVIGNFAEKNREILLNKTVFSPLRKPYIETGAGIENIFKIIRIDALWRLSYLENPNIAKFGIRGSLQIQF